MKPTARPNKENSQWGNPQRRLENWENANAERRLVLSSSHAFRYRFYFPQLLSLVAHFHHSYSNTCKLLTVCRQSRLHARRRGIKTQAWLILTHSCWDKKPFAESLTYPLHLCAISISCGQTETQVNILHADSLRWKKKWSKGFTDLLVLVGRFHGRKQRTCSKTTNHSVRVVVSFTVLVCGWHMVAYSLPPAPWHIPICCNARSSYFTYTMSTYVI